MSFLMSPSIKSVHLHLNSIGFHENRVKDTIESATRDAFDQVFMNFPIYEHIKLFMDKDIKMKW